MRGFMIKRIMGIIIFLSFCLVLSSCETIRGAGEGFGKDVSNTCNNAVKIGKNLKKADERMQEKLW
jgi:predicted small secreted protein